MIKVGIEEISTGHVYNDDLTLYNGEGDLYSYFETKKEAILFSNQLVKSHPEFACWVSNEDDEMVYYKSALEERFY